MWSTKKRRRREHFDRQLTAAGQHEPIIRLVDTTIFTSATTAGERHSHRNPGRLGGHQFRIDGVLTQAIAADC